MKQILAKEQMKFFEVRMNLHSVIGYKIFALGEICFYIGKMNNFKIFNTVFGANS